jgi:hypothetical protein
MTQEGNATYYQNALRAMESGLRWRITAEDISKDVIDKLRGIQRDDLGRILPDHHHAPLMNELGCSRAATFLSGIVNKITHLARYENTERIHRQVTHFTQQWVYELTRNMKQWAPAGKPKVQHPRIVVSIIENAIVESKSRAYQGFEADLTGKSWHVTETLGNQERDHAPSILDRIRGKK